MKRIFLAALLTASIAMAHAESKTVSIPDFQRDFLAVIIDYAGKYEAEPKALKKSVLYTQRTEAFGKLKGSPKKVTGWYGKITTLGTNSDGDAFVSLSLLAGNVTVGTWNNSFSDINKGTLIKQGTPLYNQLAEMEEGNIVKFSGAIGRFKNLTEQGKMEEPEFEFKFSAIEKVGDAQSAD